MRLGKRDPAYDRRDALFTEFRDPATHVVVPSNFGHYGVIHDWGVLGNDQYGDCVWAGADHETQLLNKLAARDVSFTAENTLSDYAAVTGFSADDPSTDQGTVVRDALSYRLKTGVVDSSGRRHKIGAYVALEPGNWDHIKEALYLFGVVGVGFQFPGSAMDQFNQGRTWTVVPGASVEGGHYVPLIAYQNGLIGVTWGRTQRISKTFFEKYCDEAYGILSPEMLTDDKSLEGFDQAQLKQYLAQLRTSR